MEDLEYYRNATLDPKKELLKKLSADFILENSGVFDCGNYDSETVKDIKMRFRNWHNREIAKDLIKFLGE
jgi:hypothetical protein